MRDDDIAAEAPIASETSPLLGTGTPGTNGSGNGTESNGTISTTTAEIPDPNGSKNGQARPGEVQGLPEHIRKRLPVLVPAIGIGIFLCALDQLLVVATYPKIGSDLKALNLTSWIATSYYLTLTSFQPLYGKLSDIFGRKECLLFSYAVFALGCAGCGLAQDMPQLIAARAVAGIGGGGMNAVVSIMLSDLVPLRDRGIWQGYLNVIFAAGSSAGGALGGLFAESIGWRWSFIGQVPLCLVAFVAVYFVLEMPRGDTTHWAKKLGRVDFLGAFFLIAAVTCLLVGLDSGSNYGWDNLMTIIPLALSSPLFLLFVLVEIKVAAHPFAPGHIIFDRSLFACYLCNFFGVAGQMPILFFLPLAYQAVDGMSAVQSGALLIPGSVASVLASIASGWIIRRTGRYYTITIVSFGLLLVSCVVLVTFTGGITNSIVGSTAGLVIGMLGASSALTTTLVGLLSNAAKEDTAVVVACSYLFRSLGTAIGISVQSAVLQQVLRTQLAARLGSGSEAATIESGVRQSLDYIKELEPSVAALVRHCYQLATMAVWGSNGLFNVLALVSAFFIHEKMIG